MVFLKSPSYAKREESFREKLLTQSHMYSLPDVKRSTLARTLARTHSGIAFYIRNTWLKFNTEINLMRKRLKRAHDTGSNAYCND